MSPPDRPIDATELDAVVQEVLRRLDGTGCAAVDPGPDGGLFQDLESAVAAAGRAQRELQDLPLEARANLIEAMRRCGREEAPILSRLAVEETGLGRIDDKVNKNLLVAEKTPGLEILRPWAESGDRGLTLQELAPWGVVGLVTPCTNPTETILCNAIGVIAAGNAAVACPHPLAKGVSGRLVAALNRALVGAGGPANLLCVLREPSIELAQALMHHPGIRMLAVTGGPAVVREALRSGKRVLGAGPGNPPAVVDETADLEKAGRDLVLGASLDNNIVCTDEKEVFVVAAVADRLKEAMEAAGAHEIHAPQVERLLAEILIQQKGEPEVRKEWIGKDAERILELIGVRPRREVRLVLAEVEPEHPLVWTEQLLPVLPLVRTRTAEEAMELALKAEKGNRHTAIMHSHHVGRLSEMARRVDTSIFVKNGPSYAGLGLGGEGYTSFTIAGATGEGLTTARDFCRVRRCTLVDAFRIV